MGSPIQTIFTAGRMLLLPMWPTGSRWKCLDSARSCVTLRHTPALLASAARLPAQLLVTVLWLAAKPPSAGTRQGGEGKLWEEQGWKKVEWGCFWAGRGQEERSNTNACLGPGSAKLLVQGQWNHSPGQVNKSSLTLMRPLPLPRLVQLQQQGRNLVCCQSTYWGDIKSGVVMILILLKIIIIPLNSTLGFLIDERIHYFPFLISQ